MRMKKWHYWVLGILVLLIITNPSVTSFKTYLGYTSYSGLRRTTNFFICSVYANRRYNGTDSYFAIIGNFWELPKPVRNYNTQQSDTDMAKMAADTTKKWTPPADAIAMPIFHYRMSMDSFAMKIKGDFPEYRDLSNRVLVEKFIAKFPKYRDSVILK